MLIRFTTENFLSFKDEVEFSMVPGKPRKHRDHVVGSGKGNDFRLLKAGVIYGANAAGKSNLIKAMSFAKRMIVKGTKAKQRIPVTPFRFDRKTENSPSSFQFEVKCDSTSYIYGFKLDKMQVHSEWLFERRSTSLKKLFTRNTDKKGQTDVEFGTLPLTEEQNKAFLEFTAYGTRPNQLFLTESIDRNITYFEDIHSWFVNKLVLIFPDTKPSAGIGMRFMNSTEFQERFRDVLNLFDLGIDSVDLPKIDLDAESRLPDEIRDRIKQDIQEMPRESEGKTVVHIPDLNIIIVVEPDSEPSAFKFMTVHRIRHEDREVNLELMEESDGTRRLFELVPAMIDLLHEDRNRVFVIDELDRRLHAILSKKILELYLKNSGRQPTQLIVTTHESDILDLDLVRRDEIWFVEKDSSGSSTVYSLEEFAPRYDKDIRKGYLHGRFGAIPIVPNLSTLEWGRNND